MVCEWLLLFISSYGKLKNIKLEIQGKLIFFFQIELDVFEIMLTLSCTTADFNSPQYASGVNIIKSFCSMLLCRLFSLDKLIKLSCRWKESGGDQASGVQGIFKEDRS
jgi:hypothetical protein